MEEMKHFKIKSPSVIPQNFFLKFQQKFRVYCAVCTTREAKYEKL